MTAAWTIADARRTYSVPHWSEGYVDVAEGGAVVVRPLGADGPAVSFPEVIATAQRQGLRIPLLVHVADNDEDVNIDEAMQLVDALRARKPDLADVKVYRNPIGGHLFDRRWYPATGLPEGTPDQRDSWMRVWQFFGRTLQPGIATR